MNYRQLEPRAESSTCIPVTTEGAAGTPDTGQLLGVGRGNSPAARSVGGSKADREARNRAHSSPPFPELSGSDHLVLFIVFSPTTYIPLNISSPDVWGSVWL